VVGQSERKFAATAASSVLDGEQVRKSAALSGPVRSAGAVVYRISRPGPAFGQGRRAGTQSTLSLHSSTDGDPRTPRLCRCAATAASMVLAVALCVCQSASGFDCSVAAVLQADLTAKLLRDAEHQCRTTSAVRASAQLNVDHKRVHMSVCDRCIDQSIDSISAPHLLTHRVRCPSSPVRLLWHATQQYPGPDTS
jgi:hypothetical protein